MRIVTKDEYLQRRERLLKEIADGAIFVYPSDATYCIGCDATNEDAVRRLRELKHTDMPFSIIAPSKQWIRRNCVVDDSLEEALDLLPGKYVLMAQLKKNAPVAPSTTSSAFVGVRIPMHWTHELSSLLGRPIISTSANIAGGEFMTRQSDLHLDIRRLSSFCLSDGTIEGEKVEVLDVRKSRS